MEKKVRKKRKIESNLPDVNGGGKRRKLPLKKAKEYVKREENKSNDKIVQSDDKNGPVKFPNTNEGKEPVPRVERKITDRNDVKKAKVAKKAKLAKKKPKDNQKSNTEVNRDKGEPDDAVVSKINANGEAAAAATTTTTLSKKERRKKFKKELKTTLKKKGVWNEKMGKGKKGLKGKKGEDDKKGDEKKKEKQLDAKQMMARDCKNDADCKTSPPASSTTPVSPPATFNQTLTQPKSLSEISANWKTLQAILKKETKKEVVKSKRSTECGKVVGEEKRGGGKADPRRKKPRDKTEPSKVTPPTTTTLPDSKPASKADIWFELDDSDLLDIAPTESAVPIRTPLTVDYSTSSDPSSPVPVTKLLGLDCEMVGVGQDGQDSILARVSVVNQDGAVIYDAYVKPTEPVTDYRTAFSGIRPHQLGQGAKPFKEVQSDVASLLRGRILVGHALSNDLGVLFLGHPRSKTRDTQKFRPFKKVCGGMPSLKRLAAHFLGVKVQEGEHSSVEDARIAMRLYRDHRKEWEAELSEKRRKGKGKKIVKD